jgi:polar amino acid transport system substrate-binding protein
MKTLNRALLTLALVATLLITAMPVMAGKLQKQLVAESTIDQVMRRGVLRVGMDTFLPWAMKDKKGELVGFEIDVARRLAADMGVKVEFVPTKWAGIIPALLTGKFDVVIGGMGIQTKRALKVNFSIPYDYSGMAIVAHKEKAAGFTSLDDFNKSDVEIACKLGTTAVTAAKKYIPKAKLRLFDDEARPTRNCVTVTSMPWLDLLQDQHTRLLNIRNPCFCRLSPILPESQLALQYVRATLTA